MENLINVKCCYCGKDFLTIKFNYSYIYCPYCKRQQILKNEKTVKTLVGLNGKGV